MYQDSIHKKVTSIYNQFSFMYSSCPLFDKLCRVANRTNNWHNYFYKRAELKERKQISGGYKKY